jgi:hypothetical protein
MPKPGPPSTPATSADHELSDGTRAGALHVSPPSSLASCSDTHASSVELATLSTMRSAPPAPAPLATVGNGLRYVWLSSVSAVRPMTRTGALHVWPLSSERTRLTSFGAWSPQLSRRDSTKTTSAAFVRTTVGTRWQA